MRIQATQTHKGFTSLNNPITPFVMNTKKGDVLISEIPAFYLRDEKFLKRILQFFVKNFASHTKDPYWLGYHHPQNRKSMIALYASYMRPTILKDDGNMTMLTAMDDEGKLCGACLSHAYNKIPNANKTTCYIEGLAIDNRFRKCNIGETLLNTTIEANKDTFTDVFLKGENMAAGFYQKMGFEIMDKTKPFQKETVQLLAAQGEGYPDYITFFTKPLQKDQPRWYEKISEWFNS